MIKSNILLSLIILLCYVLIFCNCEENKDESISAVGFVVSVAALIKSISSGSVISHRVTEELFVRKINHEIKELEKMLNMININILLIASDIKTSFQSIPKQNNDKMISQTFNKLHNKMKNLHFKRIKDPQMLLSIVNDFKKLRKYREEHAPDRLLHDTIERNTFNRLSPHERALLNRTGITTERVISILRSSPLISARIDTVLDVTSHIYEIMAAFKIQKKVLAMVKTTVDKVNRIQKTQNIAVGDYCRSLSDIYSHLTVNYKRLSTDNSSDIKKLTIIWAHVISQIQSIWQCNNCIAFVKKEKCPLNENRKKVKWCEVIKRFGCTYKQFGSPIRNRLFPYDRPLNRNRDRTNNRHHSNRRSRSSEGSSLNPMPGWRILM